MDGIDQAVALIVRNRILLGQAMEQRLRAQQAVETAKLARRARGRAGPSGEDTALLFSVKRQQG